MFSVEINGKETKAEVTFYTASLYELEFQKDMIKDLFGTQDTSPEVEADANGNLLRIDFTKTNWTAVVRVLWAAVKTADESAPGFSAWVKRNSKMNLWAVTELLSVEVADCFFRSKTAEEAIEDQG